MFSNRDNQIRLLVSLAFSQLFETLSERCFLVTNDLVNNEKMLISVFIDLMFEKLIEAGEHLLSESHCLKEALLLGVLLKELFRLNNKVKNVKWPTETMQINLRKLAGQRLSQLDNSSSLSNCNIISSSSISIG